MTEQPETPTSQDPAQGTSVDEVSSETGAPVAGEATNDQRDAAYEDRPQAPDESQAADEAQEQPVRDDVTGDDIAEGDVREGAGPLGDEAPETGDLVIDAALRDLAETPADDLDAQIERGEQVQRTLQGRLSDLGG